MGRKGKNKKRKKSSETDSVNPQKQFKHGARNSNSSVSNSSVSDQDLSVVLCQANSVLYGEDSVDPVDCGTDQDIQVFSPTGQCPSAIVVDPIDCTNMASVELIGECGLDGSTEKQKKEPTIADVMSFLVKMDTNFNSKISAIEVRLGNLEGLDSKVNNIGKEIEKMTTLMFDRQKKVDERMSTIEDKQDSVNLSLGFTNEKVSNLEKENNRLSGDLVYLQSQSMRNNLLFSGLAEAQQEVPRQTEGMLREFMVDKLEIAQELVDQIVLERVHRVGQNVRGGPRSIVAKFSLFKDRETVRKLRSKLNGTKFYINEQFPKEVVEKRKKLLPRMKAAKNDGKQAWIAYDKLYIDGVVVKDSN